MAKLKDNPEEVLDNTQGQGKEVLQELNEEQPKNIEEVIDEQGLGGQPPVEKPTKKEKKKDTIDTSDYPANVLKALEENPSQKGLYLNKFGGLFTEDVPQRLLKDCKYYANPFTTLKNK